MTNVDYKAIHQNIYDNSSENRLRLLGFLINDRMTILNEYNTAYIYASKTDLERFNYQIGDTEGMVLLPDSSSIVFNSVNIVLLGSRVTGKNLILDKKLGNTEGLDLCNADVMGQYGIDDSFKVMGTYSIEYLGGHKFSDPKLLHSTSISDYKTVNNLCY